MNIELSNAEKWLTELGVKTDARPTSLRISRDDLMNLGFEGGSDEVLKELKIALNTKKLFWSYQDDEWLYLESF